MNRSKMLWLPGIVVLFCGCAAMLGMSNTFVEGFETECGQINVRAWNTGSGYANLPPYNLKVEDVVGRLNDVFYNLEWYEWDNTLARPRSKTSLDSLEIQCLAEVIVAVCKSRLGPKDMPVFYFPEKDFACAYYFWSQGGQLTNEVFIRLTGKTDGTYASGKNEHGVIWRYDMMGNLMKKKEWYWYFEKRI